LASIFLLSEGISHRHFHPTCPHNRIHAALRFRR
jgi:hypothetical protein